jgi:hypothetical protein
MKNALSVKIILTVLCLSFITLSPVLADNLNDAFSSKNLKTVAGSNYSTSTDINAIIGTSIQTLLGLLGIIFMLLIIYGGITWMLAEGDESKVEKAQKIIRNCVIGLIVCVSAYAISYFVISALGNSTMGQA